jgi:hypothetical protein
VAALAVAGLSGCQTKVGQAAVVDGVRLSDSDLSRYVTDKAVPFSSSGGVITPKVFALETWIDVQLFERAIRDNGGAITQAERNANESFALNGSDPADVSKAYTDKGFTKALSDLRIQEQADFLLLAERLHPDLSSTEVLQGVQGSLGQQVVSTVIKYGKKVSVSGRYGSWDATQLALSTDSQSGLPSFVTFGDGATADANK